MSVKFLSSAFLFALSTTSAMATCYSFNKIKEMNIPGVTVGGGIYGEYISSYSMKNVVNYLCRSCSKEDLELTPNKSLIINNNTATVIEGTCPASFSDIHPCGNFNKGNAHLTYDPETKTVKGSFTYDAPHGFPNYVFPVLGQPVTSDSLETPDSTTPGLNTVSLTTDHSMHSALNHPLKRFNEKSGNLKGEATNGKELKGSTTETGRANIAIPMVTIEGFFNALNSNSEFGARIMNNGQVNHHTRLCRKYYSSNSVKYSSVELCGEIVINGDDKNEITAELSSTLLNLALGAAYGPSSGVRIFISQDSFNHIPNYWRLKSYISTFETRTMVSSWFEDSSVESKTRTYVANNFQLYYVIDTELLFDLVKNKYIFPVSSENNEITVSQYMMRIYVDLITDKCSN